MKHSLALSLVLAVLLSSAAFAEVQVFKNFTLDIPEGWTAELFDEDGEPGIYTVNIEKNDKSSIMSFTYGKTDSNALEDLVTDWANMEGNSSKPERTNDGYYMYTFKNGEGKKTTVYVRSEADGKMYVAADMTGPDMQTMTAIRDSFSANDASGKPAESVSKVSEPEAEDAEEDEADADDAEEDEDEAQEKKPAANTEARYHNDNTALILAAYYGSLEKVNALLKAGSDVNAKNMYGMTALMYAAECGYADIAKALLEGGADINATNNEGSTALMIAAIHAREDAADVLIDAGADAKVKNNNGKTALDYASENENLKGSRVIKRLKKLMK